MESTELTPGSRLPHCWHTALTSNTTNISSTPSQTRRNRVPQKECTCTHTHTWTSLCPRRHPRDARVCQHTHTHWNPLIQLSHLQKAWVEYTDAHHNTSHPTSEEEGKKKKEEGKCTGAGRQTVSQILLHWSAAVFWFSAIFHRVNREELTQQRKSNIRTCLSKQICRSQFVRLH